MLVSGGKVIAIDSIKKGNTNKDTLSGDGVWTNLGVNTNVIATTKKVDDTKSELDTKINSASSALSGEIQKKQDKLKFDVNEYGKITAIGNATGTTTALAGGSNVVVSAGLNTRVDSATSGEQTIYTVNVTANPTNVTVSGENGLTARRDNSTSAYYLGLSSDYIKAITSVSSKLDQATYNAYTATADVTPYTTANEYITINNHKIGGYNWTNTIKSASSNAVDTVESRFEGNNNIYSGYNGKAFIDNTTPKWSVIGDGNRITVTSANNQYGVSWNSAGFATEEWVLGKNYLPKDVASSTYLTIASAEDIYQKKLRAGSGIVIEDDTVSVEIYVSGDLTPYSAGEGIGIDNHIVSITADYLSANALKDLSGKWESAADAVEASADKWNKTYKDVSDSAKYWNSAYDSLASAELWNTTYERVELSGKEWDKVSAKLDKVIYDDYVSKADSAYYSAGKGIAIDEHVISISAEYLSANALDNLSGNWESTYKTVETNSADWTSAASALNESATIWNETTNDFNTSSKIWNKTTNDFNTSSTLWNQTKEEFDVSSKLWNETKNRVDLSGNVWDTVVQKLDIDDFNTWSANADITPYSGVGVISIDNHKISANLSEYYKKTETSGKDELDTKFGEIENRFEPIENDVETLKANSAHYTVESVNDYINVNSANNTFELEFVSGDLATKTWVESRIADFGGFVTAHGTGEDNHPNVDNPDVKKIYLVEGTGDPDKYREWVSMDIGQSTWGWVCIGDTSVDLTQYYKKTETSSRTEISTEFTNTSAWANETFQPIGDYVTSGNYIKPGSAWVLVNDDNNIQWSGLDVSELGKKYIVTSTNNTVYVGSAQDGNTITYNLSADIPTIPGISGYNYVSAYYDENKDKYIVGLENHNVTYFAGNTTVTTSTILTNNIIPFNDGIKENITVTDGVFTIPDGVEKVTFCINETVEDNIVMNNGTAAHTFQLNKISLRCGGSVLLTTQDYYNNEVGYNELTLTYTVDLRNRDSRDYTITYEGTPLINDGVVKVNVSIKEDVIALSESTGGEGKTYNGIPGNKVIVDNNTNEIYLDTMPELSGVAPIYTSATSNYNLVGLNFDPDQFAISGEGLHSTLQIRVITSGGVIDQEAFEKLSNLINGRITETIPIGMINTVGTLSDGAAFSYLFRPVMEFDAYSGTVARVMTSNGTVGTSKSQVVISEVNETTHQIEIQWWSDKTTLTAQAGTVTLTAAPGCTDTRTLYPDKLYYATLINYDQTTHYLGFSNNFTSDVGAYDIAYYDEHGAGDYGNSLPGSLNVVSPDKLGQTAGATLKPYIAFRNEE